MILLRRTAVLAASLAAASAAVFAACAVLPGDTATVLLGDHADPASVAALRHRLGTDRPLTAQYAGWAGALLRGDLGVSPVSRLPVAAQIGDRLEVTLSLALLGTLAAVALAVPLGVLAAAHHRRPLGAAASVLGQAGMAVPAFAAGILLAYVFAVRLRVLPAGGYVPFLADPGEWLRHLVLPALALGLVQGSVLSRYVRSAVLEVMREDFVRTVRAAGSTWWGALWRHGLRNAAVPVVTVLGLQIASVLAGAIVIESVFTLPGLGQLLLRAVAGRDLILVQGTVMVLVAAVLVVNYLTDLLYLLLDPRLRTS
ncbi:ABC transporter permease [Actinomadura macrotermitis]|uniref:Glutathione transport system permease protein GsiC n=1 Tax=Actinomadura macrotermitis TaxID=2585200 RepID=A0A7K0BNC5_9ACTN|nr:ABC transporter permease [Actinomadura macrotermitis]MQY02688.1 Glutathione transport system permease protein GsiC [Actinomadura macrotermitis]